MIILGASVETEMSKGLARWMFVRSIGDVGLRPHVLWPVGIRCSLRRTLTLVCSNQDTNDAYSRLVYWLAISCVFSVCEIK